MTELYSWNTLPVQKVTSGSVILDGGGAGRVIMPRRYAGDVQEHDLLRVFVYMDSTGCPAATTEAPKATAGEFAFLKAEAADRDGIYLEWGPGAPLFLPHNPDRDPREVGKHYLVKLVIDEEGDLEARSDLLHTLSEDGSKDFEAGEAVSLLIGYPSPLGYKCIINHTHKGILYKNKVFEELTTGETRTGYIEKVREDGKLDLSLRKPGYDTEHMDKNAAKILQALYASGGTLPFHDKSSPDSIRQKFGISKKVFKQSLGRLYKERKIVFIEQGIQLKD